MTRVTLILGIWSLSLSWNAWYNVWTGDNTIRVCSSDNVKGKCFKVDINPNTKPDLLGDGQNVRYTCKRFGRWNCSWYNINISQASIYLMLPSDQVFNENCSSFYNGIKHKWVRSDKWPPKFAHDTTTIKMHEGREFSRISQRKNIAARSPN
jgi:hypothetical protein